MIVRGVGTGNSNLLARGLIGLGLAAVAGVACWWLLGRGVTTNDFPPFLEGQTSTPITRYSGPWLTAAAGAALVAALLLLAAVFDLVRWSRAGAGSIAPDQHQETNAPTPAQETPAQMIPAHVTPQVAPAHVKPAQVNPAQVNPAV